MTISDQQFESLVRSQHAAVFRTAARLLSPADAEDVTQQVFARVWEGKTALGKEPALTLRWLAARLAFNALRGARTRRRTEERRAMQTPASTTHGTLSNDEALSNDERAALRRALDDLPPDLRAAVVLRYQDDLTFEAIAHALACSLSTAHDRVRRALTRLQHALSSCGFVLVGARVSEVLPHLDAPAVIPSGLAASLLRVPHLPASAVAGTSAASIWPIAALALVGLTAAVWIGWNRKQAEVAAGRATAEAMFAANGGESRSTEKDLFSAPARAAAEPTTARALVTPQDPTPTAPQDGADGTARVFGNVFDHADGQPLRATVYARSVTRSKKGEPYTKKTETAADGRFSLEVPIGDRTQEGYSVWIRCDDYAQFNTELLLAAGAASEVRAALRRWAQDVPGEWQMEVSVQDASGQPVADASVQVHRRQPVVASEDEGLPQPRPREAHAKTDAAGRASLRGDHHGEKMVRVSVWGRDLAAATHELAITSPGPHNLTVTLPAGKSIAGVVRAVADGAPVARFSLSAKQGGHDVGVAFTPADGRFAIRGLGAEPITLVGQGAPWSSFELEDVTPGDQNLDLHVKRSDDAQARGLFASELHGRVFDAGSGKPLDVSVWDAWPVWLRQAANWREELIDNVLHPRPVQRGISGSEPEPSPEFHRTGLRPGRYTVIVRHAGYAPAFVEPIELRAGQLVAGIEVGLTRGGTVRACVVDAAGNSVAGALVYLTADADAAGSALANAKALAGGDRYPVYRYPEADKEGRVRLVRVPPGVTLRCVAVHATLGTALSDAFVLRDDDEKDFVLTLR